MLIAGRCHCGNVSLSLDWTPEPEEIPARACSCSFCLKHGGVWTSCPTGSVAVTMREPSAVASYSFGTKTADFHICTRCGVVPVATSRIDGRLYAVVSVNALEGLPNGLLQPATSVSFDHETEEARLARRKRGWIPNVTFVGPSSDPR
jgi:hypothetical protein